MVSVFLEWLITMARTIDGIRIYTCKLCGKEECLNLYNWRKKPEKSKNICTKCLNTRKTQQQVAQERARFASGYDSYFGHFIL